jgi:hypothetical protein
VIRELCSIADILRPLKEQKKITGFVVASDDAGIIKEYSQKVELALTDYQVFALTCHVVMNPSLILGS